MKKFPRQPDVPPAGYSQRPARAPGRRPPSSPAPPPRAYPPPCKFHSDFRRPTETCNTLLGQPCAFSLWLPGHVCCPPALHRRCRRRQGKRLQLPPLPTPLFIRCTRSRMHKWFSRRSALLEQRILLFDNVLCINGRTREWFKSSFKIPLYHMRVMLSMPKMSRASEINVKAAGVPPSKADVDEAKRNQTPQAISRLLVAEAGPQVKALL